MAYYHQKGGGCMAKLLLKNKRLIDEIGKLKKINTLDAVQNGIDETILNNISSIQLSNVKSDQELKSMLYEIGKIGSIKSVSIVDFDGENINIPKNLNIEHLAIKDCKYLMLINFNQKNTSLQLISITNNLNLQLINSLNTANLQYIDLYGNNLKKMPITIDSLYKNAKLNLDIQDIPIIEKQEPFLFNKLKRYTDRFNITFYDSAVIYKLNNETENYKKETINTPYNFKSACNFRDRLHQIVDYETANKKTDSEKISALFSYIKTHNNYGNETYINNTINKTINTVYSKKNHSVYDAIMQDDWVCGGQSKALCALLRTSGIDANIEPCSLPLEQEEVKIRVEKYEKKSCIPNYAIVSYIDNNKKKYVDDSNRNLFGSSIEELEELGYVITNDLANIRKIQTILRELGLNGEDSFKRASEIYHDLIKKPEKWKDVGDFLKNNDKFKAVMETVVPGLTQFINPLSKTNINKDMSLSKKSHQIDIPAFDDIVR